MKEKYAKYVSRFADLANVWELGPEQVDVVRTEEYFPAMSEHTFRT